MNKTRNINRVATYAAIMERSKEEIADELAGILMLLYHDIPGEADSYTHGWNDSRKTLRNTLGCDAWVIWEGRK